MWPWGFTDVETSNAAQLQTLGRKLAFWNDYRPFQISDQFSGDGSTVDYVYGQLGVASFGFELGTEAFQDCPTFEEKIVPGNLPSLIYAAKVAGSPYITPAGPNANKLTLSNGSDAQFESLPKQAENQPVSAGSTITLTAQIDDSQFNKRRGEEPTQNIAAAEYYLDLPPWAGVGPPQPVSMTASDGAFDSVVEQVQAVVDTRGLTHGKHIIFVRGQDVAGSWGAVSAIFLQVDGAVSYLPQIYAGKDTGSP